MFVASSKVNRLHNIEGGFEFAGSRLEREEQRSRNEKQNAIGGYDRLTLGLGADEPNSPFANLKPEGSCRRQRRNHLPYRF